MALEVILALGQRVHHVQVLDLPDGVLVHGVLQPPLLDLVEIPFARVCFLWRVEDHARVRRL